MTQAVMAQLWDDDPEYAEIAGELMVMAKDGMLNVGVNEDGEMVFWPTPKGVVLLGMAPTSEWSETYPSSPLT